MEIASERRIGEVATMDAGFEQALSGAVRARSKGAETSQIR